MKRLGILLFSRVKERHQPPCGPTALALAPTHETCPRAPYLMLCREYLLQKLLEEEMAKVNKDGTPGPAGCSGPFPSPSSSSAQSEKDKEKAKNKDKKEEDRARAVAAAADAADARGGGVR